MTHFQIDTSQRVSDALIKGAPASVIVEMLRTPWDEADVLREIEARKARLLAYEPKKGTNHG